jgi:N-acyl-D-amino-acid deacylase
MICGAPMLERILIKNGEIVDGTGSPGYCADLLVEGDRIAAVLRNKGAAPPPAADRVIDAAGQVVAPGFVDIHSHADLYVHRPDHPNVFEPLIRQGITTFVGGNCGYGVAPIAQQQLQAQQFYIEGVTAQRSDSILTWRSMADFLGLLEGQGVALNAGLLCPHGLIRLQVMGQRRAQAGSEEIGQMSRALEESIEQGALGLSTGLQYFPGLCSDSRELVALGRTVARYGGRFTSHLRSYTSNSVDQALDEVVEVSRQTGVTAQISHIFTVPWFGAAQRLVVGLARIGARHHRLSARLVPDRLLEGDMQRLLETFDRCRVSGIDLGMDVIPTTTGFTHLLAFFPPWMMADSVEAIERYLTDPEARRAIIRDIEKGRPLWPHDKVRTWSLNFFRIFGYGCATIMSVGSEKNRGLEGRRLVDIAAERSQHPIDTACDLLLEEKRQVLVFVAMDEPEDPFTLRTQYPAIAHPGVAVATDTMLLGFGRPSFLFYGCYPRFLGVHCRERRLCDLPTAIHKCTEVPARAMGLRDRGVIREGAFADLVVLDPQRVSSKADFARPDVYPEGIEHVLINGRLVLANGVYDARALAGRVLRRS